jgi:hypothetical protein
MIHTLLQYAQDRGLVSKPGYTKKTIRWVLDFNASGDQFTGLVPSDNQFFAAPDLSFSDLIALGAQKGQAAHFLVAPLGSFLGWGKDQKSESVECARRETMAWMLKEAGRVDSALEAFSKALTDDQIARSMREAVLNTRPTPKPTDLATVRFGGRYPANESTWHEWWGQFRATLRKPAGKQILMACFGTGQLVVPELTHPKVKRLSGVGLSQPHAPIITFDKKAFESYGLAQCANAAIGRETAKAYIDALDDLLEKSVV